MIIESQDIARDENAGLDERDLAEEARFILSALEAAGPLVVERRSACRVRYRVEATLHLAIDRPEDAPRRVFTRDVTPHGLGFVSSVPIPLGCGGTLYLPAPDGSMDTIACSIMRCREIVDGWFEGAVTFKEEGQKALQT